MQANVTQRNAEAAPFALVSLSHLFPCAFRYLRWSAACFVCFANSTDRQGKAELKKTATRRNNNAKACKAHELVCMLRPLPPRCCRGLRATAMSNTLFSLQLGTTGVHTADNCINLDPLFILGFRCPRARTVASIQQTNSCSLREQKRTVRGQSARECE